MSRTVLLDTHILLWAAAEPERLSPQQLEVLEDPTTTVLFSAISVAEIEIKRAIGKLEMPQTCEELRESVAAEWLPLAAHHAMMLRRLPPLHRDPFDRLLVAQAIADSIDFVSEDNRIHEYASVGLRVLRGSTT